MLLLIHVNEFWTIFWMFSLRYQGDLLIAWIRQSISFSCFESCLHFSWSLINLFACTPLFSVVVFRFCTSYVGRFSRCILVLHTYGSIKFHSFLWYLFYKWVGKGIENEKKRHETQIVQQNKDTKRNKRRERLLPFLRKFSGRLGGFFVQHKPVIVGLR